MGIRYYYFTFKIYDEDGDESYFCGTIASKDKFPMFNALESVRNQGHKSDIIIPIFSVEIAREDYNKIRNESNSVL